MEYALLMFWSEVLALKFILFGIFCTNTDFKPLQTLHNIVNCYGFSLIFNALNFLYLVCIPVGVFNTGWTSN